jgi:hypothetical protein
MFVFGSRVSQDSDQLAERTRTVTGDLCGCTGRTAISPDPRVLFSEFDYVDNSGQVMGALVLMMRMEERSGVKISLVDVFHARARSQLAALIADRSATPSVSK